MTLSKLAIATAALTLCAGAANAQSINSNQQNNANIRAKLNAIVEHVGGDVTATAAGIGNSFTVDGEGVTGVTNRQIFWGDASSLLNANVENVVGDVSLTSAAIANSATIKTSHWGGDISNTQFVNIDPTAVLNSETYDIGGEVSATAAALSNSATINSEFSRVGSNQQNFAAVNAIASATAARVAGDVTLTAAAIGNSLTVTGF
ncbi:MAG: hypothetical protein DCF28_00195 [Alphaproteobacteria bacterium]|nr:MAG: hypothetical protein DCF28_00195 [Alphaproteobacteria bacterium]